MTVHNPATSAASRAPRLSDDPQRHGVVEDTGGEPVSSRAGLVVMLELLLLLLVAAVPVLWRCKAVGIKGLTEPVTVMSAVVLFYYVLRGAALLFRDSIGGADALLAANPASHRDLALSLAYVLAGFFAFHAAYRFWSPPAPNVRSPWDWNSQKVNRAVLAAVGLAVFSTVFAIYVTGGISGALSTFGCWRVVTTGYGYPLLGLEYWGIIFAFLLQDRLYHGRHFAIAFPALLMANFCDTAVGNRTGVLATWATAFLLIFYASRALSPMRFTVLVTSMLAAGVAFSVPMARLRSNCVAGTIVRAQTAQAEAQAKAKAQAAAKAKEAAAKVPAQAKVPPPAPPATAVAPPPIIKLPSQRAVLTESIGMLRIRKVWLSALSEFVALDSFVTIISAGPSQFPFRFGKTYLDSVLFLVPRKIWPDKPRAYGYEVGQYLQKVDNNLPPGYLGELYVNFHLPGILGGMYLMGLLLRWAHASILGGDPLAVTVYAVIAPYLLIFMGRSIIGGGTLVFILIGLMLPIAYYLRRFRVTPPVQAASQAEASL